MSRINITLFFLCLLNKCHPSCIITGNSFREIDLTKLEARKRLVDRFVNAIVVYDDYILVTFNYNDGTMQISFEDIGFRCTKKLLSPKSHP